LATLDVPGEKYNVFVASPQTITSVITPAKGEISASIPDGKYYADRWAIIIIRVGILIRRIGGYFPGVTFRRT
jgi:hypothetical protein